MKIGYSRVSTKEQNLELQINALNEAGCEKIYKDKISGTIKSRPGLNSCLDNLRKGDVFVVWRLDRLGRTVKHLVELMNSLEKRGINFMSIKDNIDTSTAFGKFYFHIMAGLAQMERDLIAERTKAGLEAAKNMGRVGGRKRAMTDSKIKSAKKLLNSGITYNEVASNLGVSLPTLYRHVPASELTFETDQ